jgi:DNA-directed RNA polymerase specialized sigma subunit
MRGEDDDFSEEEETEEEIEEEIDISRDEMLQFLEESLANKNSEYYKFLGKEDLERLYLAAKKINEEEDINFMEEMAESFRLAKEREKEYSDNSLK